MPYLRPADSLPSSMGILSRVKPSFSALWKRYRRSKSSPLNVRTRPFQNQSFLHIIVGGETRADYFVLCLLGIWDSGVDWRVHLDVKRYSPVSGYWEV